jgi:GT2 family glycosyltransferase
MTRPFIVTVILNTNRREDTCAALESLAQNTYQNQQIIVLDNASTDGSVPAIQAAFPDVQIIPLEKNLGYAGNNNVGICAALALDAEWVFVLNEDTVLAPDCLEQLMIVGQSDPQIGIVGPMVYHHNEPNVIQTAGGKLGRDWSAWHLAQNELDRGQFQQPHDVDWISGCAILVRRAVIDQVGMLDQRFFYYWEETEWCMRAREAGWRIVHAPQAKLWHKGVQRDYHPSPSVTYYSTRNRFMVLEKHHAPLIAWIAAWKQTLRTLISWSIRPKWRSMLAHRDAMWQGMLDFLRHRWGMRSTIQSQ